MNSNNKNQIIGFILSILLLVTLLNSAYFFLGILKMNVNKWLAFNACSVATIIYLVCYGLFKATKKDYFLAIPLLPLYYYGTMGLFIMPWTIANVFPQITHIIITLNVTWILCNLLKEQKFDALGKGLLIGIIGFVPIIAIIQSYTQQHINEFMQILKGIL